MTRFTIFLKSILSVLLSKSVFIVLIAGISLLSSCAVMLDPPGGNRHRFRHERNDHHERDNIDERHNDEHRN
jgi:hypothetical protein